MTQILGTNKKSGFILSMSSKDQTIIRVIKLHYIFFFTGSGLFMPSDILADIIVVYLIYRTY